MCYGWFWALSLYLQFILLLHFLSVNYDFHYYDTGNNGGNLPPPLEKESCDRHLQYTVRR